jgi:hypothetical protein
VTHRRSSALLTLLLAVGILLTGTGTGLAISGLASTGPAVGAQYPDAQGAVPAAQRGEGAARPAPTLLDLQADGAGGAEGAGRPGPEREEEQGIVERSVEAVARDAGAGVREYGAIPLLLSGIAVLAAASLIRHRRGVLEQRAGGAAFG